MSKFICLLPVRDEADIIGQCLERLLAWSDEIFVFDTGSVDETWEIVQEFASRERRVTPLKKESVYFNDTVVRGWMFHEARRTLRKGDWFLRADADEFHHIMPPEFVKTRLQTHETIVYHQYYNFVLRESDVAEWDAGRETFADRARPIAERRQWYTPSVYAEPRLCRYRDSMRWPSPIGFPYNAGYVALERLPIRHYPHRDPAQLNRRCRLRAVMMADRNNRANWNIDYHYWENAEWRNFITPDDSPGLQHWTPGEPLQEVHQTNHLARGPKRLAQRLTHACLLPILDRFRPGWSESDHPHPIPPEIISRLERELQV
jgi:glycosyltransferase involved in cell wall biosynthesis